MDQTAPDAKAFAAMALKAVEEFPEPFRRLARDVVLRVEEFAPEEILEEMDLDAFELTGLYDGIPLTEKSFADQPEGPDIVWLFRRAILDEWADRGNVTLAELVAHVTVHEFAHHFGWSDADIAAIDRWWD